MQRQKRKSYFGSSYPDITRFVRTYGRTAGLGLLVGMTATGCSKLTHVDGDLAWIDTSDTAWEDTGGIAGDIGETGEIFYTMLPATGQRNLQFEEPVWGWIDYQVQLLLEDRSLYDWILANPEAALTAIDTALLRHSIVDFDEYSRDPTIEDEIKQALADAMAGSTEADTSGFRELTLIIVGYTDENDIDGDIG